MHTISLLRRSLVLALSHCALLGALACDDERVVTLAPRARTSLAATPVGNAPEQTSDLAVATTGAVPAVNDAGGGLVSKGGGKRGDLARLGALGARGRGAGGGGSSTMGTAIVGSSAVVMHGAGGYGAGEGGLGSMGMSAGRLGASASRDVSGPAPVAGGTFVHAGTNAIVDAREDKLSTFGIDVDTGSWLYARRFLQMGRAPAEASVRVEEWVNAMHYDYAGPPPGSTDAIAIHVDAAPSPFTRDHLVVRVALQGRRVQTSDRLPAHVTFLVDVSGSMSADDKLPWARDAIRTAVHAMRADDTLAIATYAGDTRLALATTKATDRDAVERAIDTLVSGGGTNMGSGMELAYREANQHLGRERSARVIVLSDGDANIGRTGHDAILASIKGYVSEGVTMSTVGFGTGNYNDHLMEQLADAGNGTYSYIGDRATMKRVFADELTQTLEVIAQDAKIQVEWNPEVVASYRLLGYENRDIADRDFRNDKKDAGEIGAGHAVTALYEVRLVDPARSPDRALGTVRVRHKVPRQTAATETSRSIDAELVNDGVLDANANAALGMALAAEILRGSKHAQGLTLANAAALLRNSAVGIHAAERREAAALLDKAPVRAVAVR